LVFCKGDGGRHFVWTAAPLKYSGLSRIFGPRLLFHTSHGGTNAGFHKGKIHPPQNLAGGRRAPLSQGQLAAVSGRVRAAGGA
jgi:hypothetical protein